MQQLSSNELETVRNQLQGIIKPFQQEQSQRQKKLDFFKKCIQSLEKNDFFQIDELLKSKLASDSLKDPDFMEYSSIFERLQNFADEKIDQYRTEFKEALLQLAQANELPLQINFPYFSILKGIEGALHFTDRRTTVNQVTLKSIDPKRIISLVIKIKRKLYDTKFEPQKFIDALFDCYKKILKETNQTEGNVVPIRQLYYEYVWSLQSKLFFQNMDKGKFKGYAIDQFTVDLWRFFASDISSTTLGYRIRLNPGRGSSLWLVDQNGERRQITHALFIKN